jgi:hypothetical protein
MCGEGSGLGRVRLALLGVALLVSVLATPAAPAAAASASQRLDLRVLVVDDDSPWVDGLRSQLDVEGVPYRAVELADPGRPVIDASFLSSGDRGFFQSVIVPDYLGGGLGSAEVAALRSYEAAFAVREIAGFNWANPAIGLEYAGYTGDLAGVTATVTEDGKAQGFQYLDGPVPFAAGSYAFVARPLSDTSSPPMPEGDSFTTLVAAPLGGSPVGGSIVGVYSSGGVEQLVITAALSFTLPQFKALAHGMVTWVTRGVHLGYNRNRFTMHVDDAFAEIALWDEEHNCTPGEDCPRDATGESIYPPIVTRMTPEDVNHAVQWQAAHDYTMTLAFNAAYTAPDDPLTQAFVANRHSFRWLNHGWEHLYQGCIQDFSVVPWRCATDATGAIQWLGHAEVLQEITQNMSVGRSYDLPFNSLEYLSGEHSGLAQLPQQPLDNPNFGQALTDAGIATIASDASREALPRRVGTAITVPRHPTAVFYNAATFEQEVDEYNWLYTSRADGGGGYCEDNPATATCIAPLDLATGYHSYIVPTDAAYNLHFILSNDPRPFFAHTSNLAEDRILYPLMEEILARYRNVFHDSAPLLNLTLTEASQHLQDQVSWSVDGMGSSPSASAYVQDGRVVVTNSGTGRVPLTVPEGAAVSGAVLEPYGGERSAWLPAAPTTTVLLDAPSLLTTGSTVFAVGSAGSVSFTVDTTPAPTISQSGTLPAGLGFTADSEGTGTIAGTPSAGTAGAYPIVVTATTGAGSVDHAVTLQVHEPPLFTSPDSTTVRESSAFSFTVTTTGSPTAQVALTSGPLPSGVTFTPSPDGSATLSGTPAAGTAGSYPVALSATNAAGTASQTFTLTVGRGPQFTSPSSATARTDEPFTFQVVATGPPTPTITRTGTLPTGLTFVDNGDGTATVAGTPGPNSYGSYQLTFTATNTFGTAKQTFTLTVEKLPSIYSSDTTTFTVGTARSFTVRSEAYPMATIAMAGTLPAGVTFTSKANGTAVLSGTPAAGTGGVYPLVLTATSSIGSATQSFELTVREAPAITSPSSVTLTRGEVADFEVTATGWPAPWVSKTGTMPPGTRFTAGRGIASITGNPTTAGTWILTITAKNGVGSVSQTLTIHVV